MSQQELIYTLDTNDNIKGYICRNCIKKLAEDFPQIIKYLVIDYKNQVYGECSWFCHEEK